MYSESGSKVWNESLDIYGKKKTAEAYLVDCPFRYQGQYEDKETGLYYNRFRYYDPETGQYVSQDPVRYASGICLYSYANDLNSFVDPLGLHIADAVYTNSNGISGQVRSFSSVKGGLHSEPQILNQLGGQKGGILEITSQGPKGDGSTSFLEVRMESLFRQNHYLLADQELQIVTHFYIIMLRQII